MRKKEVIIVIFTEFSKKIGLGHYVRSKRLFDYLKKDYKIYLYTNKSGKFIENYIKKNSKPKTFIFDLKHYRNTNYIIKKNNNYLFFDRDKKNKKNIFNINPLLPWKNKFSGPKWFCYPINFFKPNHIKKNYKKKLLLCQGGTDAHDRINYLIDIIKNKINNKTFDLNVLVPKNYKINKKLKKIYSINFHKNIKNMSKFLIKFDHIVTSCGGLSYEINSLGIGCTYVTSEPREIRLAKYLEKKKFGKYLKINHRKKIKTNIYKNIFKNKKDRLLKNKIRYFKHNGLKNIYNLIENINNEI